MAKSRLHWIYEQPTAPHTPTAEVGKVTFKSNSDEALSYEFLEKSNSDEVLNDDSLLKS